MARSIFITGYPGFIAGQLLRRFLAEPRTTVHMLVIPAMRRGRGCPPGNPLGPRPHGNHPGRHYPPSFGARRRNARRLAAEVDTVYHLAAIYDLATPQQISRLVNVTGTENVLDFCESLPHLRKLVYFSTAYVSGTRTGRALEDELEEATSWKNYYELTKWEAERAVRGKLKRIPTVIIRPGVVIGDSQTGEINKYDGPYFVIRAMVAMEKKGLIRWSRYFWSGGRDTRFYMVPVDFICDATEYLAQKEDAAGKAYHVLPNPAVTMGELAVALFSEFGVRPPPFSTPPWLARLCFNVFPSLSRALQFPPEVFAYMKHDVDYDTRNLDAALAASGIRCPPPRDCIPVMVNYVRKHPRSPPTSARTRPADRTR